MPLPQIHLRSAAKFTPPSIITLAFFILVAGNSLAGELRPSDHGLQYQLSSPPTPSGAKSPPEMLSFFGESPSPPPSGSGLLPKAARDDDDSWWREGGGNRRDRVMRHVFLAASILCGISAAALLVAFTLIYSFREASPINERSLVSSHQPVLGLVCNSQRREERSLGFVVVDFIFSIKRETLDLGSYNLNNTMSMKMKGIYKGFKCISQLFAVVKERDQIEIGYPTDVKHVAHIGWEGSSGSAPCWMSEFKAGAELLSPRPSSFGNARNSSSFFSTSSSNDFDQAWSQATTSGTPREIPPADHHLPKVHNAMKPSKKKKKKSSSSTSSPRSKSSSSSSSRSSSRSTYKSTGSRLN